MEANFAISLVVSEMLTWICLGGLAVFVIFSYFPPMIDPLCLTSFAPRYHAIVSYADGQGSAPEWRDSGDRWDANVMGNYFFQRREIWSCVTCQIVFFDFFALNAHFAILVGN